MAKVFGFKGDYTGLEDGEAWTRVYDFGKNLMPIRNIKVQKKYNKMFNKKTKVIRSGQVKNIKTDDIVPDDIVIVDKGSFIPVDGIILEENGVDIDNDILFDAKYKEVDGKHYVEGKPVYQGMRVKSGKVLVEAKKTGINTFLGEFIKEIDELNINQDESEKGNFFNLFILSMVVFVLVFLFSFLKSKDIGISLAFGVIMLFSVVPVGFIVMTLIKFFEHKRRLKKARIELKNSSLLFDFDKLDIICVDSKFLIKNYESYIQNIYKSGIRIAVIGEGDLEETTNITNEAGILIDNSKFFSGEELDNLEGDSLINAICEGVIFYNVNYRQKKKILKTFREVNISTLCLGSGIQDLVSLKTSKIGISSNHVKRSIDTELADTLIWGNDFSSVYELIRRKSIFKKDLTRYLEYNAIFQLPIIVLVIMACIKNINILNFFFHWLTVVLLIIPIMLKISEKTYSEDEIFAPQKKIKEAGKFIKNILIGLGIAVLLIVGYLGIGVLIESEIINISIITAFLVFIYFLVIKLQR